MVATVVDLIEKTAAALNEEAIVMLMLLAVQRANIELSVKSSLETVGTISYIRKSEDLNKKLQECKDLLLLRLSM
jgi:hypothetical protein